MGVHSNPNSLASRVKAVYDADNNKSSAEIAAELQVPASSIYYVLHRLRNGRAPKPRIPAPALPTEADLEAARADMLDPEKRLKKIADIAVRGKDELSLKAMLELNEIQLRTGDATFLPTPTDVEDEDVRLAKMMAAVGISRAKKIMKIAFREEAMPTEAEAPEALPSEEEDGAKG